MAARISCRIFRRNSKKLILIWASASIPDVNREAISAFVESEEFENFIPVSWTKFVPDNPEKFSEDVDGIVISHSQNKIDPSKPCTIKILFGEGEDSIEVVKEILPASASPAPSAAPESVVSTSFVKAAMMYGMDYKTGKWVPISVNSNGQFISEGDE